MYLSEKIKTERNRLHLSQEQLAAKIGVSRSAIAKWEAGNGIPDIDNLIALSALFEISLDDFLKEKSQIEREAVSQREKKKKLHLISGVCYIISVAAWLGCLLTYSIASTNFEWWFPMLYVCLAAANLALAVMNFKKVISCS